MHLLFPEGLYDRNDLANDVAIAFRLRIRLRGTTTWINLPQIHYGTDTPRQIRTTISLVWGTIPGGGPSPSAQSWYLITKLAPAQTSSPASPAWAADELFLGRFGKRSSGTMAAAPPMCGTCCSTTATSASTSTPRPSRPASMRSSSSAARPMTRAACHGASFSYGRHRARPVLVQQHGH